MAKNYLIQFGNGNPTLFTGLSPTFVFFKGFPGGVSLAPPAGITEIASGQGLYYFTFEPLTSVGCSSVAFLIDGATTSLTSSARYLAGNLDPIQAVDELVSGQSFGYGASLMGLLGSTASSFGSTSADPATVFGYLKRLMEFNEGDSVFTKSNGLWDIYARGNAIGASTQLIEKAITDSGSVVTKV
jgi:hypothetical protein